MTTSGTFAFAPNLGELTMQAYARIGIRRPQVTATHLLDARNEANLLFAEWANAGPNLWTVDQQSLTLVQGTASYTVDPSTIMILDARITVGGIDRVITSISRSEYNDYPNKAMQGPPTTYWFDRLISPSVTLWPVPDNSSYTLNYFRFRQNQDAAMAGGQMPEVPYRWLDAMVWGLAERLSYIWAPDRTQAVGARYLVSYQAASTQDVENAPMTFRLDTSDYYR